MAGLDTGFFIGHFKNMKQKLFFLILAVLILIFASCAQDRAALKKRADASKELGLAYMMQEKYIFALEYFLKAEKLNPKDPYIQNNLGLVYMIKKRPDNALEHFKKAYALKPDFMPALNNLGSAYLALKKWNDAIACFKRVYSDILYATPHYPLSNIGRAYYNKKEYMLAEKYYLKSLKVMPDFQTSLYGLFEVYIQTREYEQAKTLFKKIIDSNPKSILAEKARKVMKNYRSN
jgi:type IV pilus assembly protein PilF